MSDEGMSEPAMMTPDEIARAYLKSTIENKRAHLDKCIREVSAFMAADDVNLVTFTRRWESARVEAETTLRVYETLRDIVANGDEYREQHENLLSVRQSDLTALAARLDAAERERDALREALAMLANIAEQYVLEVDGAQKRGASWYTQGASGLYQQVMLWSGRMRATIDRARASLTANHSAPAP